MRYEARPMYGNWRIFDHVAHSWMTEEYSVQRVAETAAEALEQGIMVATRGSYTREVWARLQQGQAHQVYFSTPAEVAENRAQDAKERSIWDAILTQAVPDLA